MNPVLRGRLPGQFFFKYHLNQELHFFFCTCFLATKKLWPRFEKKNNYTSTRRAQKRPSKARACIRVEGGKGTRKEGGGGIGT